MIQKKVCLLGSFAVGKTSLVARFVTSIFSEKYLTTVGVKIDKKTVRVGEQEVNLVLWDIEGEDEFQKLRLSYLRGASGYLLVVDGTRRATLEVALNLYRSAEEAFGAKPCVALALNKEDLAAEWELDDGATESLAARGWTVIRTSAKTGQGVEEAFLALATKMMSAAPISPREAKP
jgi:hypothetical protein